MEKKTPEQLLRADHKKVKELFKRFEDTEDQNQKKEIVREALSELKVHTTLEEELFYPAIREHAKDEEDMDEAIEEHDVAKHLIEQLEGMGPEDERYDAKFIVLSEMVKHHIEEEEGEMFPQNKEVCEDEDLGGLMLERKLQLQEEARGSEPHSRSQGGPASRPGARRVPQSRRAAAHHREKGRKE